MGRGRSKRREGRDLRGGERQEITGKEEEDRRGKIRKKRKLEEAKGERRAKVEIKEKG